MAATLDYKGRTYSFCQQECKVEFLKDPEKWVKSGAHSAKKPETGGAAPS